MQQKRVHSKPCGLYWLYSSNELTNYKTMKDSSTWNVAKTVGIFWTQKWKDKSDIKEYDEGDY
jgi:hypothetical protein